MSDMKLLVAKRLREFREDVLRISALDLSERTGIHVKTIRSFENGLSSNMSHLQTYFNQTDETNEQQFIDMIHQLMKEIKNGN